MLWLFRYDSLGLNCGNAFNSNYFQREREMNHTKYCLLFIKNCSKRLIIHCFNEITIECLLISIAHDTAAKR